MGTFDTPAYVQARESRLRNLFQHVRPWDLTGVRILEVGCGTGEIGEEFVKLGAQVVSVDARPEHIIEMRKRFPDRPCWPVDLDDPEMGWGVSSVDIILCWGILYHLSTPRDFLERCAKIAPVIYLETQVLDSSEALVRPAIESGPDQSINGQGCRPSPRWIEETLGRMGYEVEDISSGVANWQGAVFDWTPINDGLSMRNGAMLRKMYICKRRLQ